MSYVSFLFKKIHYSIVWNQFLNFHTGIFNWFYILCDSEK